LEWLQKMMDAVGYMEDHMEEPVEMAKIAQTACSSPFHFQRMFHMLTGSTVMEYIRKRRLTLAAQELAVQKVKVIDVALKYGYETPESFAKAFKQLHGISPTAARLPGQELKAFPRISFQISLKGDQKMDYRIVEKETFFVVGKAYEVSTKNGENLKKIPGFWTDCNQDGTCEKLGKDFKAREIFGICMDMEQEKERFTYMIGVEGGADYEGKEYCVRQIPALTWAVFTSTGSMPDAIQKVEERIFQEWFPSTGYEHADGPELEVYPPGDMNAEDYRCEVWIPILKK
jgi:AraC family transcriptional regulator